MTERCGPCSLPCLYGGIYDQCVGYTGFGIEYFNIKSYDLDKNQNLQEVIFKIGTGTEKFIKSNVVDISPLLKCTDKAGRTTTKGLQEVINWAGNLNSNDYFINSPLFCLGSNVSSQGLILGTRGFTYELTGNVAGTTFTYNLEEATQNLPSGIEFQSAEIIIEGSNPGSSRTILGRSSEIIGGITLTESNYPAIAHFKLNYYTEAGQIELTQSVGPLRGGNMPTQSASFLVKSYNNTASGDLKLKGTDYYTLVNGTICSLKQFAESLRYIQISDCGDIKYPNKHISSVIPVMGSWVCSHEKRLNDIGNEKIKEWLCDDTCKERLVSITLQEWITKKDQKICELEGKVTNHEKRIVELEGQVKKILEML